MLEARIILTAVIGYIIGIIWGLYCKISIVPFYILIYLLYLIFKKEKNNTKFKLISFKRYFRYIKLIFSKKVIKIMIISLTLSNSIVLFQNYRYDNIYKNQDGKNIDITGIVVSVNKDRCKVKVKTKMYKNTYLYVYFNKNIELKYGDEIILNGIFESPKKRSNYKGFDYKNYLKTLKIYGIVKAKSIKILTHDKGNIILKYTNKLTIKIKEIINSSEMSDEEKAILEGILLGEKQNISKETINDFSKSNISYILAISGMHISYIILISNFIGSKTFGKHISKITTSMIIIIYMCITSFTPSVVRAGITGIISIMSNFFYRKNDIWESMGLSLLLILFYNPFLIQNIGLLLSFSGVIGIVTFKETLEKLIEESLDRKNRIAIRKNKVISKLIIKIMNTKIFKIIQNATLVTVSATLTVMPVVLISFNKVNITSLIISILTSFIIGEIVILGLISIITKINIIQKILSIFLKILISFSKLGNNLPLSQIYLVTPNLLEIIIYYILIFSVFFIIKINLVKNKSAFQIRIKNLLSLAKYKIRNNKKKAISIILTICLINLIIFLTPKSLKIYFVDVGQGDCTLIKTPRNKIILIDGGGNEKQDYNVRRRNFNAIFIR